MIPLKLDIQGLYSYKEKQTIDFTQLTAAGLFGIFGAVGSGKSSILEAILLALYGSTERLSDRGEKNSMVNLQSDHLLIQFEFRAGKNNGQTYLSRYSAKRNPKNFEEVKPAEHTFYLKKGEALEPLNLKAEEIIGMKKDHFKQTVIIPQGKFREFIDLTPGPRAEMMKELFGLERFDLAGNTVGLLKTLKENKIRLETLLGGLVDISEDRLREKESAMEKLRISLRQLAADFMVSEKEFQNQETLQSKHQQLLRFKAEWKELEAKLPDIEQKKSTYKDYLKAKNHLEPIWKQIKEAEIELEKYKISVLDCSRFKETYKEEIAALLEQEAELKKTAEERPLREAKIRDLKKVLEIQPLLEAKSTFEKAIANLKPEVDRMTDDQVTLQKEVREVELKYDQLVLPDTSQLSDLKSADNQWQNLEDQLAQFQPVLEDLTQKETDLKAEISAIKSNIPESYPDFGTWVDAQKDLIKKQEEQREMLIQKNGLTAHLHLLKDGNPCPLCGAIEHPDPLDTNEKADLEAVHGEEIVQAKEKLDKIHSLRERLKEKEIRLEGIENNLKQKKQEITHSQTLREAIREKLAGMDINSRESLQSFIKATDQTVKEKDTLAQRLKAWRKKLEAGREELEAKAQNLRNTEQKLLECQSTVLAKKEEIRDPAFSRGYLNKTPDAIEGVIKSVLKNIQETANKLESKQKVLIETRGRQATNLANLENYIELEAKTSQKINLLKKEFEELMLQHGFESPEALMALFQQSLDVEKIDIEIRRFEDRWLVVNSKIKDLENEPGVTDFLPEGFEKMRLKVTEQKEILEGLKKDFALLEQEILSLKNQLLAKQGYEKEFVQLEKRETYLRELERLFKGSGFVKYVSTIYLKELCNTANLRFTKLTKNSLSLEIDDNNTFWVIDYLNGGKRRLLKTLSGGQTFQASLCLALALAEKVKSLNKADQSFFFLDEGFGALDRNALRVVFETLKALRHENRIVGIISHVEELQQEIEVFAKITLDPEAGSQVNYSYL